MRIVSVVFLVYALGEFHAPFFEKVFSALPSFRSAFTPTLHLPPKHTPTRPKWYNVALNFAEALIYYNCLFFKSLFGT